jgi:hypothetical protein
LKELAKVTIAAAAVFAVVKAMAQRIEHPPAEQQQVTFDRYMRGHPNVAATVSFIADSPKVYSASVLAFYAWWKLS